MGLSPTSGLGGAGLGGAGVGGAGISKAAAAPAYVGPLDLVPGAVVAYSAARALSADMLGQDALTIIRDSDDASNTYSYDATTGEVDSAAIETFIGSTFNQTGETTEFSQDITLVSATGVKVGQRITGTGIPTDTVVIDISLAPVISISNAATASNSGVTLTFSRRGAISSLTDNSGNAKTATMATANQRPQFVASSFGTKPGMFFARALQQLLTTASITLPDGEYTTFIVAKDASDVYAIGINATAYSGAGEIFSVYTSDSAAEGNNWLASSDGEVATGAGGLATQIGADDPNGNIFDTAFEFGSSSFRMNGQARTSNTNFDRGIPGSISGAFAIGSIDAVDTSQTFTGYMVEILVYSGIMSDANRLAIRQNIATFYGITLS